MANKSKNSTARGGKNNKNLKGYDFGSFMQSYGTSIGMDKNLGWDQYSAMQQGVTGANLAGSALATAGGIAGGIVASTDNDNRYTTKDAWSHGLAKTGSRMASLGSAGMMLGGPVGGAIGLGAGLLVGATESVISAEKGLKEQETKDRVSGIATATKSIANMGAQRNIRQNKNLGIPGMDKGVYKFYSNKDSSANAMIAHGETVISPDGSAHNIPGTYNPGNPDTVSASLANGSSVLPKNPMFRLPEGKSTPADIGKKIEEIQRRGNEIMKSRTTSFIDRNTAQINKTNTDIALDKLDLYSESLRDRLGVNTNIPKFNFGDSDIMLGSDGKPLPDQELGGVTVTAKRPTKAFIPLANNNTDISANKNIWDGNYIQLTGRELNTGTGNPTPLVDMAQSYKFNSKPVPLILKGAATPSSDFTYKLPTPTWQSAVKNGIDPRFAPPVKVLKTNSTSTTGNNDQDGAGNENPTKFDYNDLLKVGSLGTAIGASLDQYFNATPEVVQPNTYVPYYARNRSDLYNQLRDVQARENIARYNNRVMGGNAGSAMALNAASQRISNMASQTAYDTNYRQLMNIDNINRQEQSRIYNMNMQEATRINDINMRSRAAARNIKYAAIQDIAKTLYPHKYDTKQ